MKLLIVAAWEPELSRFRERLAQAEPVGPGGLDFVLATLGVGLVETSIAMTRCVDREQPDAALLLGTCGAFGAAIAPGSVVVGARARLVDAAVTDGTAALPPPMPHVAELDVGLHDALVSAGARSVQIANTVGITTDDALAARLARGGADAGAAACDVEHLEAFAFARACEVAGVRGGAVLGVANVVGARGRGEWLANHVRASQAAADFAWNALGAIAASLADLSARTTTTARSPERA